MRWSWGRAWLLAVWLGAGVGSDPALAQTRAGAVAAADTLAVRPPPALSGDSARGPFATPARPDAGVPLDLSVARRARGSALQESPLARGVASVVEFASFPGSVLLAGALFGAGELDDRADLRDLGLRAGGAIGVAGAVTAAGKIAVGRARPYASPDDPYQLGLGRGWSGDAYQSFPSAHTAFAFATATVLAADLADRHPGPAVWVVPTTYGVAGLAGLSRIFHDEHWATDVLAGAVIGTLSGWGVWELSGGGNP